jgi:hypothetical protein
MSERDGADDAGESGSESSEFLLIRRTKGHGNLNRVEMAGEIRFSTQTEFVVRALCGAREFNSYTGKHNLGRATQQNERRACLW